MKLLDNIFSKNGLLFILVLFIPLVLPSFLEGTVAKYLVEPFFSKIERNYYTDLVAIFVLLLVLVDLFRKFSRRYLVSWNWFYIVLIIGIWLLGYRITEQVWFFTRFEFLPYFAYSDIFFVYFLGISLLLAYHFISPYPKPNLGFLTDESQTDNDSFGRKGFAKSLAGKLIDTQSLNHSFAVGIVGQWGSGKTTFLNFIKEELENIKKTQKDLILIEFNAWQFDKSATLIDDFFNNLKGQLKSYNSDLSSQLTNYAQQLVSLESNLLTRISQIGLNTISKEKSLDELFEDINTTLRKLNKKIIIFIDDLDRLDNTEIIEVIRLIRNTANFANTFFLVAYDKAYVNNAIKNINEYNYRKYLEKIFQLEIDLPKIIGSVNKDYIIKTLKEKLPEKEQEIDKYFHIKQSKNITTIVGFKPVNIIQSIREANRLINSFLLAYSNLDKELDFADLLNIEILRLYYPKIYKAISRRDYGWLTKSNRTVRLSYLGQYYVLARYVDEKGILIERETKVEKDLSNESLFNYENDDVSKIVNLLNHIFNINYPSPTSIQFPNNFDKYFAYRLLEKSLSYEEFVIAKNNLSADEFTKKISEWIKDGYQKDLVDFLERLKHDDSLANVEEFEKVILGVLHLDRIAQSISSDALFDLFITWEKLYKEKDQLKEFMKDTYLNIPSPYHYRIEYFEFINGSISPSDHVLSALEQKEILLEYITVTTEKENELNREISDIYFVSHQIRNQTTITIDRKIDEKFIEFITKKDPIGFFIFFVVDGHRPSRTKSQYGIRFEGIAFKQPTFGIAYNSGELDPDRSIDKLITFYKNLNIEKLTSQINEAVSFLESYKLSHPNYVEYNFKEIDILKKYQ